MSNDNPRKPFRFRFTYFKASGKYYTDGEMDCAVGTCEPEGRTPYMQDIIDRIKALRQAGEGSCLPGITSTWNDGFILITCEEGYPCLVLPDETKHPVMAGMLMGVDPAKPGEDRTVVHIVAGE